MDSFLRRWLDEARKFLPWWQAFLLVLVAALMKVVVQTAGVAAWDLIRRIHMDVEPSPPPISDGGLASDRDLPPAQPDPNAVPPVNGDAG